MAVIASQFISRKAREAGPEAREILNAGLRAEIDTAGCLDFARHDDMEPYAKPREKKVGTNRPKFSHLPSAVETRTRQERQAEKQAVAAERRAIKKSARRHLKQQLLEELEEGISKSEARNPKQ
jgi:hypothetical protein